MNPDGTFCRLDECFGFCIFVVVKETALMVNTLLFVHVYK